MVEQLINSIHIHIVLCECEDTVRPVSTVTIPVFIIGFQLLVYIDNLGFEG